MALVARYIREGSLGTGSGNSWENAADITNLDNQCVLAGPGGYVFLRAGDDFLVDATQAFSATGTQVGTATAPVRIRGASVDGSPAYATLRSNRMSPWDRDIKTPQGFSGFDIRTNYCELSHLSFKDFGDGCIKANKIGVQTGFRMHHIRSRNVRRLFVADPDAVLEDAVFYDIVGHGHSKGYMRFEGANRKLFLHNIHADSEFQGKDSFSAGIQFVGDLTGGTEDALVEDCTMMNHWFDIAQADTVNYYNGDGYSTEANDTRITFRRCSAIGNSDGGFDLKGINVFLEGCLAERNGRNFRFWGEQKATGCLSRLPEKAGEKGNAHIWAGRPTTNIRTIFEDGILDGSESLSSAVHMEDGGTLTLRNTKVIQPVGATYRFDEGTGNTLYDTDRVTKIVADHWTP